MGLLVLNIAKKQKRLRAGKESIGFSDALFGIAEAF